MADNIYLMQEVLRQCRQKQISLRCIIKLDFRKAFDSIQWSFLQSVLLGFPTQFVSLIMQCVETASYLVSVNGDLFGFFKGQYSVRQDDPLSPYLFIAYMKYFSTLQQCTQQSVFNFHLKHKALGISHLAFANDILLLYRCDLSFVCIFHQQLLDFGRMSGPNTNAAKSSIYFSGVGETTKQVILHFISQGSLKVASPSDTLASL